MDVLVFIAAFLFGLDVGLGTAIVSWGVYGFVNPYGQAGFPLILFLMVGESIYALAGGVLRRATSGYVQSVFLFGATGLVATFAFDLITNFATYLFLASSLYDALIIGLVTGAPLALVHELSNLVFFAFVAPGVIVAAKSTTFRPTGARPCR